MDMDYKRIGEHLKRFRKMKELTQAEVAEILGVTSNTYSSIERGQFCANLKRTVQLCALYGVKPGAVLDDCCDAFIEMDLPVIEECEDKRQLRLLIDKCSDETAHMINVMAQAVYRDNENR